MIWSRRGWRACGGHRAGQRLARQRVVVAQRQGGLGRLAQRRRQRQRHALQAGRHLHLGHPAAKGQCQCVGRAARGLAGQLRQQPHLRRLLQPVGGSRALRTQLDGRFRGRGIGGQGAHAPFQAHIAAQRPGLHADQRKPRLAELHRAARTAEHRRVGGDAHVVAGQGNTALHPGLVDVADGQGQLELEVGLASAAGLCQGIARQARERRGVHHAEQFGQRTARVGIDTDHGVRKIGDGGLHPRHAHAGRACKAAAGATHLHGRALEDQLALQLRERRPAQRVVRMQLGGTKA